MVPKIFEIYEKNIEHLLSLAEGTLKLKVNIENQQVKNRQETPIVLIAVLETPIQALKATAQFPALFSVLSDGYP